MSEIFRKDIHYFINTNVFSKKIVPTAEVFNLFLANFHDFTPKCNNLEHVS